MEKLFIECTFECSFEFYEKTIEKFVKEYGDKVIIDYNLNKSMTISHILSITSQV